MKVELITFDEQNLYFKLINNTWKNPEIVFNLFEKLILNFVENQQNCWFYYFRQKIDQKPV